MRDLRHAPTAFWFAVLLSLAVLAVLGWVLSAAGQDPARSIAAPAQAPRADVQLLVTELSGVYPALSAGTGGAWAADYARMAHTGYERYLATSADKRLDAEWKDVVRAADELVKADPDDSGAYTAAAGTLGAAVGRLSQAAQPRP